MLITSTLQENQVQQTLSNLHAQAKGDHKLMLKFLPNMLMGMLKGESMMKTLTPSMLKDAYMPVSVEQGRFLYGLAMSMKAKHIVEFGSSFGVGSIYLAAAARDNEGHLITTEIEPVKCLETRKNLLKAGLSEHATLLEGDALVTLQDIDDGVDLVFMDGWKNLYNDVLDVLIPKLKFGSVVIGDNINLAEGKEYFKRVSAKGSGFITTALNKETSISFYMGSV